MQTTPSLTSQRRVTLYGVRARKTPEDQNEREIRATIRNVLPEVFDRMFSLDSQGLLTKEMHRRAKGLFLRQRVGVGMSAVLVCLALRTDKSRTNLAFPALADVH